MSSSKLEKEDLMLPVNPSSEERMETDDNQNPSLMQTPISSSSQLSNKAPQLNSTALQKVVNAYTQSAKKQKTFGDHPTPSPTLTTTSLSSQLDKGAQRPHSKQQLTTPSDDQKRSNSQTPIDSYYLSSSQLKKPAKTMPTKIYEKEKTDEKSMTVDTPKQSFNRTDEAKRGLDEYGCSKGKTWTEEVPKASLNQENEDTTGLDEYIRSLYRRFPSANDVNGTIHLNERGKRGMAARSSRTTFQKTLSNNNSTKSSHR
jgi:hypothetical protein